MPSDNFHLHHKIQQRLLIMTLLKTSASQLLRRVSSQETTALPLYPFSLTVSLSRSLRLEATRMHRSVKDPCFLLQPPWQRLRSMFLPPWPLSQLLSLVLVHQQYLLWPHLFMSPAWPDCLLTLDLSIRTALPTDLRQALNLRQEKITIMDLVQLLSPL